MQLRLVAADGSAERALVTAPPGGGLGSVTWSPSGERLAYTTTVNARSRIDIIRLANGSVYKLTSDVGLNSDVTWSPSGRWIAYVRTTPGPRSRAAVYVVHPDGSGVRRITGFARSFTDLDWARDSVRLALSATAGGDRCPRVAVARVDRHVATLVRGGLCSFDPAWSPDGRWLAFDRQGSPARTWGIALERRDGSGLRWLVRPSQRPDGGPVWSPDGTRIAFGVPGPSDGSAGTPTFLMTVRVDGRGLRQISQTRAQPRTPGGQADVVRDWSRDGRWVMFERSWSVEAFAASLYVVHPDGTGLRQLAGGNGETGVRFGSASFER